MKILAFFLAFNLGLMAYRILEGWEESYLLAVIIEGVFALICVLLEQFLISLREGKKKDGSA